jgi:hypothetical protein
MVRSNGGGICEEQDKEQREGKDKGQVNSQDVEKVRKGIRSRAGIL